MKRLGSARKARRNEVHAKIEEAYEPAVRKVKDWLLLQGDIEARDAVHTVAVRLLGNGVPRVRNWVGYLARAAVYEHRHAHRNGKLVFFSELSEDERRRIFEEVPGPIPSPATLAAEADFQALIQAQVAKLPPRQRAVVTLWSQNFTHREIADTLGLRRVETSRSTLRDGLAALGRRLRAVGISDCTFCARKHSR